MQRLQRNPGSLADGEFDLLVIGGGITGAFLAHDAVLRGLSVALVEKHDFGAFTSSASSKLLHGGVRYLPKGQVWKVRESYRETAIFQHIAPHLTRWVPFLVPTESGSMMKGKAAMQLAMLLYGLCGTGIDRMIADPDKRPPRRNFLTPDAARDRAPLLNTLAGLTGAQVLWESHMHNSERMTLAVLKTAAGGGGQIANYCAVQQLLCHGDRVVGAQVLDRISNTVFDIRARFTVNAAGPHVQAINESVPELRLKRELTGFSKGVHLVTRQLEPEYALALTTGKKLEGLVSRGGRHFFIIPWRGCSLIGTTNVPFNGSLDQVRVTEGDITTFLDDINGALPEVRLTEDDVRYAFCGLYPLIASEVRADTYQGTGEYQVIDHGRAHGVNGVLTVLGSKFTTARAVAEQAINLVMERLGRAGVACQTSTVRLQEGDIDGYQHFVHQCRQLYAPELAEPLITEMIANHGAEVHGLIEQGRKQHLLQVATPGRKVLELEIDHAIRFEMTMTLEDLIFRRTGLGTIGNPGSAVIDHCARLMAAYHGWSEADRKRQVATVHNRYIYPSGCQKDNAH